MPFPIGTAPLIVVYGINDVLQVPDRWDIAIAPTVLNIPSNLIGFKMVQTVRSPDDKIMANTIALNLQPKYEPTPEAPNPTEPRFWGDIGRKDRQALLSLRNVGQSNQPRLLYLPRHYTVKDATPLYDLCDVPVFSLYDEVDRLPYQDDLWAFQKLESIAKTVGTFGVAIDIRKGVTAERVQRNALLACAFGASIITFFNYARSDQVQMSSILPTLFGQIENPIWFDVAGYPERSGSDHFIVRGIGFELMIKDNGDLFCDNTYSRRTISP